MTYECARKTFERLYVRQTNSQVVQVKFWADLIFPFDADFINKNARFTSLSDLLFYNVGSFPQGKSFKGLHASLETQIV